MASASCTLFCSVSQFLFLLLPLSIIVVIQSSDTCPKKSFNFNCSDSIHNEEFPISLFTTNSLPYKCGGSCELVCDYPNRTMIKCSDDDKELPHRVLEINATSLTITIAVDDPDEWIYDSCNVYSYLNSTLPLFNSVSLFITGLPGRNGTFLGCSYPEEDEQRDHPFSRYCGQKDGVVYGSNYDHGKPLPSRPGCMMFVMDFSLLEKPATAPGPSPKDTRNLWKIILSVFLVIVITTAALIVIITYLRQRNGKPSLRPLPSSIMSLIHTRSDLEEGSTNNGVTVFPYAELQEVTNNFDPARELGEGGFGVVYHGKLNDGREVAVKRMFEKNYRQIEQFKNEIQLLTNVRHPNLVTLYGSTSRHSRELLLVYEYIPNGTLSDHLHGRQSKSALLLWPARLNIAIQTASALCYLHFKDIIHRDVKSNNILLDKTFVAKVADFGLSRLFPSDVSHVSTAPQGTPGYLDPEYHQCYHLTDRSDVYSFGVVLVELISSREAVDFGREGHEVNLANYAMNRIQGCEFGELVDVNLGYDKSFKVRRMTNLVAELAFRCLQHEREIRPSMEEVLEELKRIESVDYDDLEAEEMG